MQNKKRTYMPTVGGSSLLVIFAALCLTVFAVLTVGTADADRRLSDVSADAVTAYYAADLRAEEIFAAIRAGEIPEGVEVSGNIYSYSCEISPTQTLFVKIEKTGEGFAVLRWQSVSSNT